MFRGLITYLPAPITCTGAVLLRLPTLAEVFLWGERTALACHPRVTLCGRGTQAEGTRQVVTQQLANQQQRTQEAAQQITRASTDTYKDFLDSMFFFYQGVSRGPRYVSKKSREEPRMRRGASKRLK